MNKFNKDTFPKGTVWVRNKNTPDEQLMVVGVCEQGIIVLADTNGYGLVWSAFANGGEYSTDGRQTWQPAPTDETETEPATAEDVVNN